VRVGWTVTSSAVTSTPSAQALEVAMGLVHLVRTLARWARLSHSTIQWMS
jgi:hypothetical protein